MDMTKRTGNARFALATTLLAATGALLLAACGAEERGSGAPATRTPATDASGGGSTADETAQSTYTCAGCGKTVTQATNLPAPSC